MSTIQLNLFGAPILAEDGVPIDLPSPKALGLLAYLAVTGTRHRRATLAALLWPESDPARAQNSLRYTLSLLARALNGAWLAVDRNTVGLDGSQLGAVDVVRFRTLLAECQTHGHSARETCPECLSTLGQAVELYAGDFMAGFTLRDSMEFNTWRSLEAEALQQELVDALRRLVEGCSAQGKVKQAIEYAKRWLALDRLDEAAHQALMRLYVRSDQRTAALRQYEACERVLMETLGVSPSEETRRLHTTIRERPSPQSPVPPLAVAAAREILCPNCHAPNAEGAMFCMRCGTRLALICPQCGTQLSSGPEARFCPSCGTQVSAPPPADTSDSIPERLERVMPREFAQRLISTRGEVARERRVVTILLSDVEGSRPITQELDPEEVMEVMEGALDVLIEPVTRYEGTLARLMGDAVLAFFGAPIAHEDDAERACRAALEIIEGAHAYATRLEQERGIAGFNVRVAIHTGLVVVGDVGPDLRVEYTAMGDAVDLASGMQQAAEPGTVLITDDTHRLIAPLFETEALGAIRVRDGAEPVPAYRVLALTDVVGKGRGIAGLASPLVGREAEFRALREALERLQVGVGGIVTIAGEAGIGKSRLVAEVRRDGASLDPRWVEGRCLSYGTSIAYLLWREVLRELLGMTPDASPVVLRDALRARLRSLCPTPFDDVYPFLGRLMSLPLEAQAETRLQGLDPEGLKFLTFRAVEALIECTVEQHPLVLVCEDLHWADPTSLELLEHLLALTDRASLLVMCVFRPYAELGCCGLREAAARSFRHRHTDLRLNPLSASESRILVGNLLDVDTLPEQLRESILSHAEGNPLYVEEVIRSLIDNEAIVQDEATGHWQAVRDVADIDVPDTLQGVLTARIDRLDEEARRVLQMASVVGRIFLFRVLAAIAASRASTEEERSLRKNLLTLQREEMIRERARMPELEYIFKHHLTREAAYNGLLRSERRRFHRQVAEALERLFPERIEEQLGLVAHHWEQAEDQERAIGYLRRAGEQAAAQFANEEAVGYFSRALGLTPEEDLAARYDLLLFRERVRDLQGAREAQTQDLAALEALVAALGDHRKRVEVALRRADYGMQTSDYPATMAAAQEAIDLARSIGDLHLEASAHLETGRVLYDLGDYGASQHSLERALSLAREAGTSASLRAEPQAEDSIEPSRRLEASCLFQIGFVCYYQGNLERCMLYVGQALRLSRELGEQDTEGSALWLLGGTLLRQGEYDSAEMHLRQSLQIFRQLGDRHETAFTLYNLGWLRYMLGDYDGARLHYEQFLTIVRQTQHARGVSIALSHLAFVSLRLGDGEQAREYAQEALRVGVQAGDRYAQALALMALGYALVELARLDEASEAFQGALDLR